MLEAGFIRNEQDAMRIFCGRYVGMLKRRGSAYDFAVQDMERNESLICGENFDFQSALVEVTNMLQGLEELRSSHS
jgi:hypothetical protein